MIKEVTTQQLASMQNRVDELVFLDVRTQAEWKYVGVPKLPHVNFVEWLCFPNNSANPDFLSQVQTLSPSTDHEIYLICRSGVRSLAAAKALADAGYTQLFNVTDGFEGDLDQNKQRGCLNGWKASGLPWAQN